MRAPDSTHGYRAFRLGDRELFRPASIKPAVPRCERCGRATREGKPVCAEHVTEMPYVRELLRELERRDAELALLADGKGPAPLHEDEVLAVLAVKGPRTVARLARDLFACPSGGARLAMTLAVALSGNGRAVLCETRRGFPALALPGEAPAHWKRLDALPDQESLDEPASHHEARVFSQADPGWGRLDPLRVRAFMRTRRWSCASVAEYVRGATGSYADQKLVRRWLAGQPLPPDVREALWVLVEPASA